LGYKRYQSRLETDIGYARLKRAGSSAKKRLAAARKSIAQKDAKKFYSEIAKALLQYIGDKTNRPAFGLTKEEIKSELEEKNINEQKINELTGLLDLCDYARFTPGSSTPEELARTLKLAEKLIIDLEREYV
jgi:5'-3' exonuclease